MTGLPLALHFVGGNQQLKPALSQKEPFWDGPSAVQYFKVTLSFDEMDAAGGRRHRV